RRSSDLVDEGAVDAVRQGVEEGHVEVAVDYAAGGERQGHATQGKRHRVAEHQQQAHGGEHVEVDEFGHHRRSTFSPTWAPPRPVANSRFLRISATPWTIRVAGMIKSRVLSR